LPTATNNRAKSVDISAVVKPSDTSKKLSLELPIVGLRNEF